MTVTLDRRRQRRDLLLELAVRDVKVRYRRSVLGIAWSQLAPLSMIAVLSFVFGHVIKLSIPHYPAFLFASLLAWMWFQASAIAGTQSVVSGRDLVRQPGFPVPLLPVVAIGTNLINFMLALPVMLVWIGISVGRIPITAVALPVIIAIQFLVMLGPVYILAAANVTFRDLTHIVEIALLPLFYATPVIYARPPHRFHWVFDVNPLSHLMTAYRSILIDGRWPSLTPLLVLTAVGIAFTWLGYRVFVRLSARFSGEL